MRRIVISVMLLLFCSGFGLAQTLKVFFSDSPKIRSFKISKYNYSDSLAVQKALIDCVLRFYSKGFLTTSIDSFVSNSSGILAYGKLGERYKWIDVKPDSLTSLLLNEQDLYFQRLYGKPISPR